MKLAEVVLEKTVSDAIWVAKVLSDAGIGFSWTIDEGNIDFKIGGGQLEEARPALRTPGLPSRDWIN